ncbi:MAG: alkaline shock response membrane anchor protein AmaP [Syntrophomonadaceae bacterium]|nr:alkaline shock response membrane anchor protein AmaP [Syntrophomonadaceae bacterium]
MEKTWRLVLFLYNLLLACLAGIVVAAAAGRPEPLYYIRLALSTPQNRVVLGTIAILILVLALFLLFAGIKRTSKPDETILVKSELNGQVSITVPAIKLIIMRAVKKVEGVRDIRPAVSNAQDGLVVYLHMMINPEHNVPEMSRKLQEVVKQYLEEIGGLQVSEVKVLVDDFNVAQKSTS